MSKCYRCGTVFKYDKYDGVCPKCSAYNRKDGVGSRDVDTCYHSDGLSHTRDEHEYEFEQKFDYKSDANSYEDASSNSKKVNTAAIDAEKIRREFENIGSEIKNKEILTKQPLIIVVIVLFVLGIVLGIVKTSTSHLEGKYQYKKTETGITDEVKPIEYALNQEIDLGDGYGFTVEEVTPVLEAKKSKNIPKGEKLIAIKCKKRNDDNVDIEYSPLDDIYIKTSNSEYRKCFNASDLYDTDDKYDKNQENFYHTLSQYAKTQEGYIYALIPKDDTRGILIVNCVDKDSRKLLNIYNIPFDLEGDSNEGGAV